MSAFLLLPSSLLPFSPSPPSPAILPSPLSTSSHRMPPLPHHLLPLPLNVRVSRTYSGGGFGPKEVGWVRKGPIYRSVGWLGWWRRREAAIFGSNVADRSEGSRVGEDGLGGFRRRFSMFVGGFCGGEGEEEDGEEEGACGGRKWRGKKGEWPATREKRRREEGRRRKADMASTCHPRGCRVSLFCICGGIFLGIFCHVSYQGPK